jgi:uncharacterized caspase-like protein
LALLISGYRDGNHLHTVPGPADNRQQAACLVIGNSAYRNVSSLINPVNDATDIAAKLRTLQFDVLLGTDVSQAKLSALLDEFRAKVTREHVALVFYAGHGVTVNRESFLLPIDTPRPSRSTTRVSCAATQPTVR